jgi:prepilin-type N-terminal cleavage/methylation domain-containing protein
MRRNTRSGFTLIEVVLAVALCAMVMALIYGVVISTIQAAEQVDELTHGSEIGPAILAQIREDVGGAFLPGKDQDFFMGQERAGRDRLDFVSSTAVFASETPGSEPKVHSINEIGYQVKEGPAPDDGLVLYRRVDPFLDAEPLRGGRLTPVAEKIVSFKVTYWNGKEWLNSWASSNRRIRFHRRSGRLKLRVPDRKADGGFSNARSQP